MRLLQLAFEFEPLVCVVRHLAAARRVQHEVEQVGKSTELPLRRPQLPVRKWMVVLARAQKPA